MSSDERMINLMIKRLKARVNVVNTKINNKDFKVFTEVELNHEHNLIQHELGWLESQKSKYSSEFSRQSEVLRAMKDVKYPILWMKNMEYILGRLSNFEPAEIAAVELKPGEEKIDFLIEFYLSSGKFIPAPYMEEIIKKMRLEKFVIFKGAALGHSSGVFGSVPPIIRGFISVISEEYIRVRAAERVRRLSDDEYIVGEMAAAAAVYAMPAHLRVNNQHNISGIPDMWPWSSSTWKPTPDDRRKEIVKAAHLLWSEYERLNRTEVAPARRCAICDRTNFSPPRSGHEDTDGWWWIDYDLCSLCHGMNEKF